MRTKMMVAALLAAAIGAAAALVGCTGGESQPKGPAVKPKQIAVLMYSEYGQEVLKQFERKHKIKLRMDVYESPDELVPKLQQGGASQYDVIIVSDQKVPALIKLGLVQALDKSKLPNMGNISPEFERPQYDPDSKHSAPYQWGTVGLMYNTDKIKTEPSKLSWSLVFDPAQQPGKVVLMDSVRDMLGVALKYQGKSMNTRDPAEVKAAGDLVLAAKQSAKFLGFEGGVGAKNKVVAGDAVAAVVYNGDAIKARSDSEKVAFAVPREGGVIWVDVMMIPAKAPSAEGAHTFINWVLDPELGAELSNAIHYATPNMAALTKILDTDRQNPGIYPPPQVKARLEYLHDLDKDERIYNEVWTSVKAK